jgi:DNA-binding PadR family transcriptional regulator
MIDIGYIASSTMPPKPRGFSHNRLQVLGCFSESPDAELSGADIMRQTGLASGSLYPILIVFEEQGLLKSSWESEKPSILGRPRRRLYRITPRGVQTAREARDYYFSLLPLSPVKDEI